MIMIAGERVSEEMVRGMGIRIGMEDDMRRRRKGRGVKRRRERGIAAPTATGIDTPTAIAMNIPTAIGKDTAMSEEIGTMGEIGEETGRKTGDDSDSHRMSAYIYA